VPYCHLVVPDAEMAHFLARTKAGQPHGTVILPNLAGLPTSLPALMDAARSSGGDLTGWEWAGPGEGFCLDLADLVNSPPNRPPAA
jgi:hypothetical protein